MPLPNCASEATGTRSSATKTTAATDFFEMHFMGLPPYLVFGLPGLAGIGMRVLLARGRWAARGFASYVPVAVRGFDRLVFAARKVLLVNALRDQFFAQLVLVAVLSVRYWLAFDFSFAEARGNNLRFLFLATRGKCHRQECNCQEIFH